ncbi:hypothetical protein Sjap_012751 [Stephania japonica]|uniref:Uncharacterized protein n=1 Tax=Stephania japonica TaxID=461633 RepID=A0AAP0IWQ2_9MAGN
MNVSNSTAIHQSPLKSILPRSIAFKAPNQSTLLMASNAVQIVNKASSDKLLKKFAELDEDELSPRRRSSSGSARDALRVMVVKRQRRSFRVIGLDDHSNGESISQSWKSSSSGCNSRALADQKTCLISRCGANGRRSSPAMLRRLGLIRVGEFKNKSLLRAIEKVN